MTHYVPRRGQEQVLAFQKGKMGVSAVPGSGKTHTLAVLAAQLVRDRIETDQEVLVVTLVNSAVDNFRKRIDALVSGGGQRLLPGFGYRVRTLHSLAHEIVRERPGLVGLAEDFAIIDERQADAIRDEAVEAWLRANPESADPYLADTLGSGNAQWIRKKKWPSLVRNLAGAFIKRAKDLQLTPAELLQRLEAQGSPAMTLAEMAVEVYVSYQQSLAYRGAVDFDDLIRLALEALKRDPEYLARLQHRWPFILEDEAQDSSRLQEEILKRLAGEGNHWVRVGDPNQAIYQTFTTADPGHLRDFLQVGGVQAVALGQSGRSQRAIIDLANHLVDWTCTEHPSKHARQHAFHAQYIQPTGESDPQQNPATDLTSVQFVNDRFAPDDELRYVVDSLAKWLPDHQDSSVAVLAPRNQRGIDLAELLRKRGLPYVELLRSSSDTRKTAGALGNILHCLADPTSARKLATVFRVWKREETEDPDAAPVLKAAAKRIRGCSAVEAYLWPRADHDWLASIGDRLSPQEAILLQEFQRVARRWHRAAVLPIDQLVLGLAGDLFREPGSLALAHKLAGLLRTVAEAHPNFSLSELVQELAVIARNERRFLGFASQDTGFKPPEGAVTVATMHKAKGLEWDRVYLMSVNNYGFPSAEAMDTYISEPWYIRDGLNLEAEALRQLALLDAKAEDQPRVERLHAGEGTATLEAREQYVAERLRLLYVGITRARRDLIVTWNRGNRPSHALQPALPFVELQRYLSERAEGEGDG